MKVLHAVLSLDCGGLEQVVVQLCQLAVARGEQPEVLCLERPGTLSAALTTYGVQVHCVSKPPGLNIRWTQRKLEDVLKSVQPDIIHTHQIGVLFHVGIPAHRLRIPVIHTEHGKHYEHSFKRRWMARFAGRFAPRFVCVSSDIAESVRRYHIAPRKRIRIVQNGVNVDHFSNSDGREEIRSGLGISDASFVIGTVGRLSDVKRQDLLIRAYATTTKTKPNLHLVIVGDGEKREALESLANKLGIDQTVHFVGYRTDRERFLKAMDLFALTSRSEGMPLAVLEAWAAGQPVVASDCGGNLGIIHADKNGLLFRSGDEFALADCFSRIIEDVQLRQLVAERGNTDVRTKFTLSHMAANYRQLYREVLCGKGKSMRQSEF